MNYRRHQWTCVVFLTLFAICSCAAGAEDKSEQGESISANSTIPPDSSVLSRLEAAGIVVRQGFVGVKEENLPASVNYIDSTLYGRSYAVDLAVKVNGFERDPAPRQTLLVNPSAEWHRSTLTGKESDKLSAALNFEYFLGIGAVTNGLIFQGKTSVTRDVLQDKTEESASLLATLRHAGGAGDHLGFLGYGFYYPYLGVEYFRNLQITQGTTTLAPAVDFSVATARLYLEAYPFNRNPKGSRRFQFLGTYTYRDRIGGDQSAKGYGLVELTVLYYLDSALRSAIAYSYEDGHNPVNNFRDDRKSTISLKVKLGG